MMSQMKNTQMTTHGAAKYLGLSSRTLESWRIYRSDGPPFYKIGARVFYESTDLDAWKSTRRRTSTSDTRSKVS